MEGAPKCWCIFSAADNYWTDLHMLIKPGSSILYEDMDPVRQVNERRRMILRNPHIVDEYFSNRFEEFFKVYFGSDCLDAVWNWYQIEYQTR